MTSIYEENMKFVPDRALFVLLIPPWDLCCPCLRLNKTFNEKELPPSNCSCSYTRVVFIPQGTEYFLDRPPISKPYETIVQL